MNCIRCNAELKDDAKVCDSCGAEQTPCAGSVPAALAEKGKKIHFGIISLVLVLLGYSLRGLVDVVLSLLISVLGFGVYRFLSVGTSFLCLIIFVLAALVGIVALIKKQLSGLVGLVFAGLAGFFAILLIILGFVNFAR